jgi:hypothetical protein
MPGPVKNIFTEKWMKEFEIMLREEKEAGSGSSNRHKHKRDSGSRNPKTQAQAKTQATHKPKDQA